MKKDNKDIPKFRSELTRKETNRVVKNCGALNILYYSLASYEFNHVSTCDISKEIWDALVTIYGGTSQVHESKISPYVHQYELFKMLSGGSIKGMYLSLIHI